MPTLKLTHLPKDIQLLDITVIMCFPAEKHEEQRGYWALKQWVSMAADKYDQAGAEEGYSEALSKHIGSWFGGFIHHVGSWPALARAISGPGHGKYPPVKEALSYIASGFIAGSVLEDILKRGGGVSGAAERFCNDNNDRIFKTLRVKPPAMDSRHIQDNIWPRYKEAAHLWAAWLKAEKYILPKTPHRYFPLDQWRSEALAPYEPQGLRGFINLSNRYRNEAINYIPTNGPREPLLDKAASWEIIL